MIPSIPDIRDKITKSGISQRKICRDLKLDATWLNKVLNGKISDPSYKKTKYILDYLEQKVDVNKTTARDICKHPLVKVKIGMTLSEISKILKKWSFTQAPVTYQNHIIGVITTYKIVELLNTSNFDKNSVLQKKHVIEVLTIPYDYPVGNIAKNLVYNPCLLVEKDGKKYGIITIEDIMIHQLKTNERKN